MWILPSRNRPHLIARVFEAAPTEPGVLVIDADQIGLYADVKLPSNWARLVQPRGNLAPKVNAVFKLLPDEPYYGVISDDCIARTDCWDVELTTAAGQWRVAWGSNPHFPDRIGVFAMGGELARACGFVLCPALQHFYTDDVIERIAGRFNLGVYRPDVLIEHCHFSTGQTPADQTTHERPSHADDLMAYKRWVVMEWPKLEHCLASVIPAMQSSAPKLKGYCEA